MRFLKTLLVLLLAIVSSQGHPLDKSSSQKDQALPLNPDEPEKISSSKDKPSLEQKPEIPASSLKPQSDIKPPLAASDPQKPCALLKDCEMKYGNNLERSHDEYDQRQNGTENYRIQVDGLVLVLAPVDALLLAGGAGVGGSGGSDLMGNLTSILGSSNFKSNNEPSTSESIHSEYNKPLHHSDPKPTEGPISIKLINLIAPLLEQRRLHFK